MVQPLRRPLIIALTILAVAAVRHQSDQLLRASESARVDAETTNAGPLALNVAPATTTSHSSTPRWTQPAIDKVRRITEQGVVSAVKWCGRDKLAFLDDRGVMLWSANTGAAVQLTDRRPMSSFTWTADCATLLAAFRERGRTMAISIGTDGEVKELASIEDVTATVMWDDVRPVFVGSGERQAFADAVLPVGDAVPMITSTPWVAGRHIVVIRSGKPFRVLSGAGDFDFAELSPGGSKMVYHNSSSGLVVLNIQTGAATTLQGFTAAKWIDDQQLLVAEVNDDGLAVTAVSLHIVDVKRSSVTRVVTPSGYRGAQYDLSGDASRIAFIADGALFVGRLLH